MMRKDRNEAAATTTAATTTAASTTNASTSAASDAEKTPAAQQESISENEESDTITDHSSSMSERKNRPIGATQFSVHRSDTDCLRMRISAIRPTASACTELKRKSSPQKNSTDKSATTKAINDKANNNSLEALKLKPHTRRQTSSNSTSVQSTGRERSVPIDSKTLTMSAKTATCFSDATESGCSEATTTTIAAATEKSTKKVKVKRKKAPAKSNDTKQKNKKSYLPSASKAAFSSDSDDDEPLTKLQQQRAPRLLLTAISSKNTPAKPSAASNANNADKMCLSSSDIELPDLVSAAIKRVESDIEDTGGECSTKLNAKTKHLPQYQSTLLQDFVEKTQRLNQTPVVTPAHVSAATPSPAVVSATSKQPSNLQFGVTGTTTVKKRRGRPRKINSVQARTETATATSAPMLAATTINESADSGVISTTSTAQSASPSPRLSCALPKTEIACPSPTKSTTTEMGTASSSKPKIDFVNLDKRMYATERVLYPPPRNKRRQSSSAAALQHFDKKSSMGSVFTPAKLAKEDPQLDPVWRKIDVNNKFRRPSVSGYRSDGGGGNTTICSKILAAQSGYVSDYGSAHPRHHHSNHNSGYKSDASGKSRYSTRSCASSRRSRAKSCGYRSDCKEVDRAVIKSNRFRRKHRSVSLMRQHSKSVGSLNDEHDILQLAGLSLGQSSEESNEYACKPGLKCLPTTSVSKKYGEINRFIATGEYFGRGTASGSNSKRLFNSAKHEGAGPHDVFRNISGKLNLVRKNSLASELAADMLSHTSRKIKSRRSSAASYCSSYFSGVSKVKHRRRRRSFRFPSSSKAYTMDSKLLTEIDILTNTFATLCRIQHVQKSSPGGASLKEKEKPFGETFGSSMKLQPLCSVGKRDTRDKRSLKKRKLSENLDFALLAASVAGSGSSLTPSSGSNKRRHKKANSSSPDDHKLPLKKRHYLLTPGEKSTEAAAVAAKLFGNNAEALAAVAAAAKSSPGSLAASSVSQQRCSSKNAKPAITPKKRHLLQTAILAEDANSLKTSSSHSSPLRINIETGAGGIASSKMLDISPALSTGSNSKHNSDAQLHKKRSRLEGLVSKIAGHSDSGSIKTSTPQIDSENSSCPPPGVFEPTVELEIQIPPIAKLTEAAAIITKSEVDSPLLMELNKTFPLPSTKVEGGRVVEALLNKTGGNLLLKRKRKKINRTGFPTVRRKKRKVNEHLLLDVTPDIIEQVEHARSTPLAKAKASPAPVCDRVPQAGEDSNTFLERENRAPPRLSVVSLERLQGAVAKQESVAGKRQHRRQERLEKEKSEDACTLDKKLEVPRNAKQIKLDEASIENVKPANRGRPRRKTLVTTAMPEISTTKSMQVVEAPKSENLKTNNKVGKTSILPTNRVLTQKELEARRLLPAGIDPKINFSCKIRLKRRSSLHGNAVTGTAKDTSLVNAKNNSTASKDALPRTSEDSLPATAKNTPSTPTKGTSPLSTKDASVTKTESRESSTPAKDSASGKDTSPLTAKKTASTADKNNYTTLSKHSSTTSREYSSSISSKDTSSISTTGTSSTPAKNTFLTPIANGSPTEATDTKDLSAETPNKDPHCDQLEHDVLPQNDAGFGSSAAAAESEATSSDTSDEKSSTASTLGGRKNLRWRKTYLPAGLFSDYFKSLEPPTIMGKRQQKKLAASNFKEASSPPQSLPSLPPVPVETSSLQQPLLPPPPYCEKYFRRTEIDFNLPYDIWWAYKNAKLPARVTVPSWNYRKIRTNIYAESVRPNMAGFDHPTCNCKPDIGCGDDCLNRLVYTECSPSCCPTRDKCRNQKIQRHEVAPGVERFMTQNKGWGVRTKLPIQKGTYILEYVGEVVTEREFKDRMGTVYLNDIHHYCLHLDGGLVIDGHRMGSDGRFVNHSCQPNCEMQKWSVNGLSRMALFAARNIAADEELTYDYNFSLFNPSEGQPCRCDTPQCRGVIGGKSQRIKPLPTNEQEAIGPPAKESGRKGRQRKCKAKKNSVWFRSKGAAYPRVQLLSEKEKKYIKQHAVFLLRSFEKIRKFSAQYGLAKTPPQTGRKTPPPLSVIPLPSSLSTTATTKISNRRPSTPASLAAQISALRTPRNMKTRGLVFANSDPELEKMAKMAGILRDICIALEAIKDASDDKTSLTSVVLAQTNGGGSASGSRKKKLAKATEQKDDIPDFLTIQTNIEKGFYKQPTEFDIDMQLAFEHAKRLHDEDATKLSALETLADLYAKKKQEAYKLLLEVSNEAACTAFIGTSKLLEKEASEKATNDVKPEATNEDITKISTVEPELNISDSSLNSSSKSADVNSTPIEDIIRCICGLYKDEGLMIQCAKCMVWQHTECTKADVNAESYLCEKCEPREVDREIPLEDFTEEGHRYYLTLLRGELLVRQGDTVYVLRDIPVKDEEGKIIPSKKHTYETIGPIDHSECDIFRVERLWKNGEGKRFIFGHHFLRPHETFHEPTRRFYPNEVVRVPLYEVVPIELVIGRCWVLDRTTFCKGRPVECKDDAHCYICELRVDKSARFFSKAKVNYPTCTKSYAFRKFPEKLKISKTYAPHDVDPSMLKTKKQKTDMEQEPSTSTPSPSITAAEASKPPSASRKRQSSNSSPTVVLQVVGPTQKTFKTKRAHLENVLKSVKLRTQKNTQLTNEPPVDLSYLLSGRGARQRKSNVSSAATLANVPV